MFKSKKLSKLKNVKHGFFNKNGGVSKGIYKSLNCGIGSKDNKKNVKKNLKIVKNKICIKSKEIFLVKQIHSNKFIFINEKSKITNRSKAVDAIITNKTQLDTRMPGQKKYNVTERAFDERKKIQDHLWVLKG